MLIRINSGGGSLATANMLVNAIRESQAHVHGFIESTCASAATLVYLACHSYSLSEDADMMIHTSSSMYGGKEHEQHSYITHHLMNLLTTKRNITVLFMLLSTIH